LTVVVDGEVEGLLKGVCSPDVVSKEEGCRGQSREGERDDGGTEGSLQRDGVSVKVSIASREGIIGYKEESRRDEGEEIFGDERGDVGEVAEEPCEDKARQKDDGDLNSEAFLGSFVGQGHVRVIVQ